MTVRIEFLKQIGLPKISIKIHAYEAKRDTVFLSCTLSALFPFFKKESKKYESLIRNCAFDARNFVNFTPVKGPRILL